MKKTKPMYRKISDTFSFAVTRKRTVEEYSEHEPESDPTPSPRALRVVTTDGHCISESTRPPAKCRQVTPIRVPSRKRFA